MEEETAGENASKEFLLCGNLHFCDLQFELKKQQSEAFERKRRGNSQSGEKKGFGGSGGASRFAYTNRLEILDEED